MKTQASKSSRQNKPKAPAGDGPKAKLRLKRELKPLAALLPDGRAITSITELPQAVVLPTETGKIKLETSTMSPAVMLDTLSTISTGMAATAAYASLSVLADVQGARTALTTVIQNIQNLEIQLREARLLQAQWMTACGSTLNRAAIACENEDSDPTTLTNAGWILRRGRGPSQDMPPPSGLKMKQTGYAGKGMARWNSVPNAQYYEVQVDPVPGAPITIGESVLLTTARVKLELPYVAPGSLVTVCVRAVGAKGAGPFCDALTARVN